MYYIDKKKIDIFKQKVTNLFWGDPTTRQKKRFYTLFIFFILASWLNLFFGFSHLGAFEETVCAKQVQQGAGALWKCPNCGYKNRVWELICNNCGQWR